MESTTPLSAVLDVVPEVEHAFGYGSGVFVQPRATASDDATAVVTDVASGDFRFEAPSDATAAANDWCEYVDDASGMPYWYSEARGESTWDPPEGWEPAAGVDAAEPASEPGADAAEPASEPTSEPAATEEPEPKPASRKPTRKAPSPEPEEPRVVESVEDLGV